MNNDYILLDTMGKTLKANKQLIKAENNLKRKLNKSLLYDFTLLNQFNFDNELLEKLKLDSMKYISILNRYTYTTTTNNLYDEFDYINGNIYFKAIRIYSNKKNKYVYTIMQLVKCELYHASRKTVYNEFKTIKEYKAQTGNDYNLYDYKIS
ncbi:MAG TPA: hypothetical protein GXZ90_02000 [Clostridiales bacterium]|nr:hypothetical protein [Clostridiales bacterium]